MDQDDLLFELLDVLMSEQYSTVRADVCGRSARAQERAQAIRCGHDWENDILVGSEGEIDCRVWESFSLCRRVSGWQKILAKGCKQCMSRDINQDVPSNQWAAEIKRQS